MTAAEVEYLQMHTLMDVLGSALGQFDEYTESHSMAVSNLNVIITTKLCPGWTLQELQEIAAGGALHDIGKLSVPRQTLNGTTTDLSPEEWARIHNHPLKGVEIILGTGLPIPQIVRDCIEFHHERWDGRRDCFRPGYPHGLKGEAIPFCARVTALSDTWDALTHERTYQRARSHADALAVLRTLADEDLDPTLVEQFAKRVYPELAH